MTEKRCSRCGATKLVAAFPRNRSRADGLSERCRSCKNAAAAALRVRKQEAATPASAISVKTCTRCRKKKPVADFYLHRNRPDGRHAQCRACMLAVQRGSYGERSKKDRKAIARRQQMFGNPKRERSGRPRSYWEEKLQAAKRGAYTLGDLKKMSAETREAIPEYAALLRLKPLPWETQSDA